MRSGTSKPALQEGHSICIALFSVSAAFSASERLSPKPLPCETSLMVRFGRVGLAYPNPQGDPGQAALRDVSFALGEGSFTWLLGPSGAGKSSVLRLMQAAIRPSSGVVSVLGTDIGQAERAALPALRRKIGIVHQEFRLLPHLSAWDNVALPLRLAGRAEAAVRQDVNEILDWLGLAAKAGRAPAELSGGEQQRIAIARAIITRPALLIADEPTSELDVFEARRLIALFVEMNRLGTAIVVATHSEDLPARHPARIITLAEGRISDAP
jgi:cell division transport system ATP-binding protein